MSSKHTDEREQLRDKAAEQLAQIVIEHWRWQVNTKRRQQQPPSSVESE